MALQARAKLAQRGELFTREVAGVSKHGVQRRRCMALRKDEAVAPLPLRVLRVVVHHAAEIQRGEDIGARKRPTGVSASRLRDHAHDVDAHVAMPAAQARSFHRPFVSLTFSYQQGTLWLHFRRVPLSQLLAAAPHGGCSAALLLLRGDAPLVVAHHELVDVAAKHRVDVARFHARCAHL